MIRALILTITLLWAPLGHTAFDQNHAAWDALLKKYVVPSSSGVASTVRYADRLVNNDVASIRIRAGDYRLDFLPYDWALNDAR